MIWHIETLMNNSPFCVVDDISQAKLHRCNSRLRLERIHAHLRNRMSEVNSEMKMPWPLGHLWPLYRSVHVRSLFSRNPRKQRNAANSRPASIIQKPQREKGVERKSHCLLIDQPKKRWLPRKQGSEVWTIVVLLDRRLGCLDHDLFTRLRFDTDQVRIAKA